MGDPTPTDAIQKEGNPKEAEGGEGANGTPGDAPKKEDHVEEIGTTNGTTWEVSHMEGADKVAKAINSGSWASGSIVTWNLKENAQNTMYFVTYTKVERKNWWRVK